MTFLTRSNEIFAKEWAKQREICEREKEKIAAKAFNYAFSDLWLPETPYIFNFDIENYGNLKRKENDMATYGDTEYVKKQMNHANYFNQGFALPTTQEGYLTTLDWEPTERTLFVRDLVQHDSPTQPEKEKFLKRMHMNNLFYNSAVPIGDTWFLDYIKQHPCFIQWLYNNKYIQEKKKFKSYGEQIFIQSKEEEDLFKRFLTLRRRLWQREAHKRGLTTEKS